MSPAAELRLVGIRTQGDERGPSGVQLEEQTSQKKTVCVDELKLKESSTEIVQRRKILWPRKPPLPHSLSLR